MVLLRPRAISQVNANQVASDYRSWCNNNGECLYKNKNRKFHGWINLSNLKSEGRVAQCGWDNGDCNHETHYGIGGYHNICPIAGINGDYVWPAKLQFSKFDFKSNNIVSTSKIKSLIIYFEHRMVAIDTETGTQYDNFGPTFHSNGGWVAKIYLTKGNTKISKTMVCNNNPKLSKNNFSSFSCKFENVSAEDLLSSDFKVNIEYNHNYNTNPGIIYMRNVIMNIKYDSATMYLEGTRDAKSLYTSKEGSNCRTLIHHIIEAGYKNGKTKIPVNKAPKKLGQKIKCIKKPKNVTIEELNSNDLQKTFRITDESEIPGIKKVVYSIQGYPKQQFYLEYNAVVRRKPTYDVIRKYKSQEDFDPNKTYIRFRDGCASNIKIYIDSVDSIPLTLNVTSQNSSTNLLDTEAIRTFHNKIKTLSCGYHNLYIQRGNETIKDAEKNKVPIQILPMNFEFKIYTNETDDHQLKFTQSKNNQTRYSNIVIERIDNEPMAEIPHLYIYDETKPSTVTDKQNIQKNQAITYSIDKYYAGEFYISLKYEGTCPQTFNKTKITIEESHKQNYDFLFTRGERGTGFDFDYLVAWEGDNIKEPIEINSIELYDAFNDIRICSDPANIGLSQVGFIKLNVKNKSNKEISGIDIELNVLTEDDNGNKVVTTKEWTNSDGIFKDFYSLFYQYNTHLNEDVQIRNLTTDNDLIDEENVYLSINKINAGSTIEMYLPFKSMREKKVFLQYLLFEEPLKINSILGCDLLSDSDNDTIEINVYDSMLTELEIFGNTDLLVLDKSYECPDECYTTKNTESGIPINDNESGGITYKITNIDTNDFSGKSVQTKIINDNELTPYGYIINDTYYPLLDNENNAIAPQTDKLRLIQKEEPRSGFVMANQLVYCYVKFPNDLETMSYTVRTDKNGLAEFYIPIPNTIDESYTVNSLSNSVLCFEFKEQKDSNFCILKNNSLTSGLDSKKNNTRLNFGNNYKTYKPGDVAYVPVYLSTDMKIRENYFIFYPKLKNNGDSDQITILYKICNIKDNQGIFKTTFKTDDLLLIPNETSKNIYCGIQTETDLKVKLNKRLVELTNLNILYITVTNSIKENQDVKVRIKLNKNPDRYLGNYEFFDINMDDGDYSVIEDDGEYHIDWLIGSMGSLESKNCTIKIKATDIGLSDIDIQIFDYLHTPEQNDIELIQSDCPKCENQEEKWTVKNSLWTKIDNKWYKLFPDGKYKERTVVNDASGMHYIWVDKQ